LNGPVLTLDPRQPVAEALAVRGARILAVGTASDLRALAGQGTRTVDLAGRALLPGLADAHFHLVYFGMASSWPDLTSATDAAQIVEMVRAAAASLPHDAWLYGRGWDPARLAGRRPPTRAELDAAAPGHPVLLSRGDGHLCLANSESLRRARIGPDTPDPPGGAILRDEAGEPTGALAEAALYLAWNAMMAELTPADFHAPLLQGCHAALAAGLTSVHAVLLENVRAELEAIRERDATGQLPLRCYLMVPIESVATLPRDLLRWRGRRARVGAAKIFADGTLFAGTAALRAPYTDNPGSQGALSHTAEALRGLLIQARGAGLQPAVHAVGDGAVEAVLDAIESVYGRRAPAQRPRIEHATVLAPDLVRRIASLGAVASLQPRRWAQMAGRLGPARGGWTNSWRALVDAGVALAAGSDAPFLQRGPGGLAGVLEAVSRGLDLTEALRTVTHGPAYAAFQEASLGALRPGMLADLTVLSGDPRRLSPGELHALRPALTVVGGEIAWEGP
ncbi:MAG: amidohydrolase, partial [Chloroflexi bacterium]|nr:amidohydrolase [Chloroflexota bacterium]